MKHGPKYLKLTADKDPVYKRDIFYDSYDLLYLLDPKISPEARIHYWRFIVTDSRNQNKK